MFSDILARANSMLQIRVITSSYTEIVSRRIVKPSATLYQIKFLPGYDSLKLFTVEFALKPLKEALERLPKLGYRTTVHTDQGFQYQHKFWRETLKEHRVFQSMSRKATCLDNAAVESFFHIMKVEVMDEHFENEEDLVQAMTEWINFYNKRRIKTKLDGKSPEKYRELAIQRAA